MTRVRVPSILGAALICGGLTFAGYSSIASAQRQSAPARLKLVRAGILSVGSDTTYPPMESVDPKRPGKYIGADVDLANALARAMGLKGAKIVTTNFNSIIPALQRRNFDIIMSSMSDNAIRRKQINFVDYMKLKASEAVLVPKSSSLRVTSYRSLCGHTVAVESGTTERDELAATSKKCGSKPITIKQYTADTDAFQSMFSGHAQSYTTDLPVALYYVKRFPTQVKFAGKSFGSGTFYGIGVAKSNPGLRAAVQKALNTIRRNGVYRRILKKYGLTSASL